MKLNVVSIREKRNSVKEILMNTNDNQSGLILDCNGDFAPVKVYEMDRNEQFTIIGKNIINQFGAGTSGADVIK